MAVNGGYGPFAEIADTIKGQLDALFASGHAKDPMLVARAMLELIELPAGKRPIRLPVDPNADDITRRVNAVHEQEYIAFLRASGMGGLLG